MHFDTDNLVVVSPDVGRAKAAKKLSDMLGCDLAIAHKGRPRHNAAEVMGIIGDIKGKTCIINDDMIDTAGTLCANVKELKAMGAGDIYVCATHGIFSGPAIERLNDAHRRVRRHRCHSRRGRRQVPRLSQSPRSSLRPSPPFTTRSPSPRSSAATSRCDPACISSSLVFLKGRKLASDPFSTPRQPSLDN